MRENVFFLLLFLSIFVKDIIFKFVSIIFSLLNLKVMKYKNRI